MADPFEGDVVVLSRNTESDGVVSLELGMPSGDPVPEWEPGAHIDLVLPVGLTRQYSLCGPENGKTWRVAVLREQDGRGGSEWIHDHAHEGTTLPARGPRNHFPLLPSPRYLFIAGGIGITPLLPMITRAHAAGAEWELHYGGRERGSMAFLDELDGHGDRVTVRPQDRHGPLDLATILAGPLDSTLVYCCGPTGLIEAVEDRCRAWPAGSLHVERFTNVVTPAEDDAEFEVELAASGVTVTVPPHLTILEAVENAGVPVLSSCTEGTCGTCETTVLEGEVDHRDVVLTDEEREANETMMICVSRARCARLVLDL
ncbi:PDR/VanB family oxidoreductase [Pseudonocardia zijingensis]|uniref:PDR/VanB family oxidoreductase n=1 Tax=Pseudonocardia zijingensis TaxID=153376 RepID=A0ABN1NDI5_9PSEU